MCGEASAINSLSVRPCITKHYQALRIHIPSTLLCNRRRPQTSTRLIAIAAALQTADVDDHLRSSTLHLIHPAPIVYITSDGPLPLATLRPWPVRSSLGRLAASDAAIGVMALNQQRHFPISHSVRASPSPDRSSGSSTDAAPPPSKKSCCMLEAACNVACQRYHPAAFLHCAAAPPPPLLGGCTALPTPSDTALEERPLTQS